MITIIWTLPDQKSTFLFPLTTTASSSSVYVCVGVCVKVMVGKRSFREQKQEIYSVCSLVGLGGELCGIPTEATSVKMPQ